MVVVEKEETWRRGSKSNHESMTCAAGFYRVIISGFMTEYLGKKVRYWVVRVPNWQRHSQSTLEFAEMGPCLEDAVACETNDTDDAEGA